MNDRTPASAWVERSRRSLSLLTLGWAAAIAYGSLVPFDYTPVPASAAFERFARMPWLDVGADGRADLIANLLLYIPLTFFGFAAVDGSRARTARGIGVVLAAALLAVAIEFAQIHFPPRTVSANDLAAELAGALIGAIGWRVAAGRAGLWLDAASRDARGALSFALTGYAIAYVLLALFPFDFVMTVQEGATKNFAEQAGLWLAPRGCGPWRSCTLQALLEALFAVPLGFALVAVRGLRSLRALAFAGIAFGATIEGLQLLLASGVSQGASVVAKAAGIVGGGVAFPHIGAAWRWLHAPQRWRLALPVAAVGYLALFAAATGVFRSGAVSWTDVWQRAGGVSLIPLFNYYYTSEVRALSSILLQAALCAPAGILLAMAVGDRSRSRGAALPAVAGAVLASMQQLARLLHPPMRADITDILIGAAAALIAYRVTLVALREFDGETGVYREATPRERSPATPRAAAAEASRTVVLAPRAAAANVATMLALSGTAAFIVALPFAQWMLGFLFVALVLLLRRAPDLWLVTILLAMPVLDLAPWSGRIRFDEFDVLMAVAVVFALAQRPTHVAPWPRWLLLALGAYALSTAVALVAPLVPWPDGGLAALAAYQTPFNALRVGRGFLWSLVLLYAIARCGPGKDIAGVSTIAVGMTLGLAAVGVVVVWERITWTGFANFHADYRVAGMFSGISTAGAQIESYLAAAAPFAMYALAATHSARMRIAALMALALMLYAVLATASRSGYAAVALSTLLFALAWLIHAAGPTRRLHALAVAAILGIALWGGVAATSVTGRIEATQRDFAERLSHWRLAAGLMDATLTTHAFGMGVGQYPGTFLLRAPPDRRPSSVAFVVADGVPMLRLGAGHSTFVDQFVPGTVDARYIARGGVRAPAGTSFVLSLAICDKWILYAIDCRGTQIAKAGTGRFEAFEAPIDAGALIAGRWPFQRPLKLSVYNSGSAAIDVKDLSLSGAGGDNVLANGDFVHGSDRWYFSADDHFPWNIFNIAVEIYFEQGQVGLALFGALVVSALLCATARALRGNLLAAAFVAGIAGYLVPALFDSVIDDPRMRMLLLLLIALAVVATRREGSSDGVASR